MVRERDGVAAQHLTSGIDTTRGTTGSRCASHERAACLTHWIGRDVDVEREARSSRRTSNSRLLPSPSTHTHTSSLLSRMAGEIESVSVVQQALWLVSVALVWGATNPLIKRGSEGVSRLPRRSNALATMVVELVYLFTRWQYVVPFAVNMMGSVLFYYALAHAGTTSALHLSP